MSIVDQTQNDERDPNAAPTRRVLPDWATSPFDRFLAQQEEALRLLHLTMRAIAALRGLPKVVQVLATIKTELGEHSTQNDEGDHTSRLEQAEAEAALAQREVDRQFPMLHAQATVALWGTLEDLVTVFLNAWITHVPAALSLEDLQKIRITLSSYLAMNDEERIDYLIERLTESLQAAQKRGINRFEEILAPFGLSGGFDDELGRHIFTLQQVRHVLVHRGGIADRRLIESCPWLGLTVGDEVTVSHEMYGKYSQAVAEYVLELIQRVRVQLGFERHLWPTSEPSRLAETTREAPTTTGDAEAGT